jgi:sugar transferase (PEP-CTERM/EpsH1 system associated)
MHRKQPISVAHVIFRLNIGGLENGLVNLVNRLPEQEFKHTIICIDTFTDFKERIHNKNVQVFAINKSPGWDSRALVRIFRLLRKLKPDIVHTRNLAALDALLPALLARVRYRIHGEHGRDVNDLDGTNRKLQLLRKLHRPLVTRYISLSRELHSYLMEKIGVPPERVTQIYNGVDTEIFDASKNSLDRCEELDAYFGAGKVVIGTVGRLDTVKNQMYLVSAFQALLENQPSLTKKVRLAVVGDGPTMTSIERYVAKTGLKELVWLPGSRDDIPDILRSFDIFVLPSLAEGISNTILEAMASCLPVVASDVGGNRELIVEGITGHLVAATDPTALRDAIASYVHDDERCRKHGQAGRNRVVKSFSIDRMVEQYRSIYERE